MIALVGVDGCRKSMVIDALRKQLSQAINHVIVIQHRTQKSQNSQESKGNDAHSLHSPFVSSVKIIYRAILWTLRYYLVYQPLINKGALLLCDRFYFDDHATNPKKYGYSGSKWLLEKIRALVPCPKTYIILDAPVDGFLEQKRDESRGEMMRQQAEFHDLVNPKKDTFYLDCTAEPIEIVTKAKKIVLNQLMKEADRRSYNQAFSRSREVTLFEQF